MVDIILSSIFAVILASVITFEIIESRNLNKRDKEMQDIIRKLEHYAFEISKTKETSIEENPPVVHDEPFEHTIILWWGLDGIRLNKDEQPSGSAGKRRLSLSLCLFRRSLPLCLDIRRGLVITRFITPQLKLAE